MKKKKFYSALFILFATFILTSCVYDESMIVGKGSIISQQIEVADFTAIEVASSASVEITKGETLSVTLSDFENLVGYWDLKVINNKLVIQTKTFTSMLNTRAKVHIIMPDQLQSTIISGSGNVNLNSAFENLENVSISGSGSVNGTTNASYTKLNLIISGSGSISLKGTANELKASTFGSGNMNLYQLNAQTADCIVSGSGDLYVNVENNLNAIIAGSGDIVYSGTPLISLTDNGSGNLRQK